jgi:hypothetical protein
MNEVERQINWLSNYITYLYFLKELYSKGRIKIDGITAEESNKEIESQIRDFYMILETLIEYYYMCIDIPF